VERQRNVNGKICKKEKPEKIDKHKEICVQAWKEFLDNRHMRVGNNVSPTHRPPLPTENSDSIRFC